MLLAIDTSSFVLSCALAEKDKLVAEWTVQKRLTHSEQLIPHMDEILKDAGVDQKEITAIAAAKVTGVVYRSPYRTCYREDSSLYMESSAYWRRYPGSAGMESGWRESFYSSPAGCPAWKRLCGDVWLF